MTAMSLIGNRLLKALGLHRLAADAGEGDVARPRFA